MPPCKSFLIFHNQFQKTASPNQKTLMKIAAIVIFGRKVSQGSSFKKIFILTQNFLLHIMLWLCRLTNFSLSFVDTVVLMS